MSDEGSDAPAAAAAERLRLEAAAVRVSFTWFGVRRALTPQQRAEAADQFGAAGEYVSAAKKLLDTRHPAYRAVTAVRGRVLGCWRGATLPYPEPGVRLIRQDQVEQFNRDLATFRSQLQQAVEGLEEQYGELKEAARSRLGGLFNPGDYPESLLGLFDLSWDFPSVEPPAYLQQLSPRLYEQEAARAAARFEEAVRLAEQAFTAEFGQLVSHLTERLSGGGEGGGGERKVFRDSAVANLAEFFARFRQLNVRSSPQLDELVEQARLAVRGVGAQDLRDSDALRQQVAAQLSAVQATLDQMLVDQPRRRILRSPHPGGARAEEVSSG